jgi:AhpD family alkylhydroperoxidase
MLMTANFMAIPSSPPNEDHTMHAERLLPTEIAPEGYKALRAVEAYLARSGLPKGLIDLVKLRASQINGCAYCLDVHAKDARKAGETEPRLYLLNAWRACRPDVPTLPSFRCHSGMVR